MEEENKLPLYLTLLPNGVAQGILGTLIPLYLIQGLQANLVDLGVMTFTASLLLIPASIFLGSLPDRARASKPYILLSFLSASILLFIMASRTSVVEFQILYVILELVNYLRGPSTSILIAETFERRVRSTLIARQGFIEGIGAVIGLGLCTILIDDLGYSGLLFLACPLKFASFLIALVTIRDSPLYIERHLDRLDGVVGKVEDFSFHLASDGSIIPSLNGDWRFGSPVNMKLFGLGRALFAFATQNFFTSLSIFLLTRVQLNTSTVFLVFLVRSIFGGLSYLFIDQLFGSSGGFSIKVGTLLRAVLVMLIPVTLLLPMPYSMVFAAIILSAVAVSGSIYLVGSSLVTLLNAQPGSFGLYDAFASLGGALGNFSGGLIPSLYGFEILFVISGALFLGALLLFYLSRI